MDQQSEQAWLSVVLPEDLKRWIRVEAALQDMSASAYVRNLFERERTSAAASETNAGAALVDGRA